MIEGMNAGTVYAALRLYDEEFTRPLARASAALDATEKTFDKKFGAMARAVDRTANALLGIGVAGAAASAGLIKIAAEYEQTEIAFKTLLGSADAAQKKLLELRDFAAKTPFQFRELTDSTKRLLALGFAGESILPMLTDIGDAVSALGGGKEMIDRVTLALGQMNAKGRVMTQEINQLTETGIPALEWLAKATGVTKERFLDMVQKGMIPADQAIQTILAGMRQNYGGMMAEQAKTAAGQLSNLKDQAEKVAVSMGTAFLPAFKQGIATLQGYVDALDALPEGQKTAIANTILYGSAIALLAGITGKFVAGPLAGLVKMLTWLSAQYTLAALTAKQKAKAVATAAGADLTQAKAADTAARAAVAEAAAMRAEFIATGQATEADIAFIAAQEAKAAAMLKASGPALTAATAKNTAAQNALAGASARAVGGAAALRGATALLTRALGLAALPLIALSYGLKKIHEENEKTAHAERNTTRAVEEGIEARRKAVEGMKPLADRYDELTGKKNKSKKETEELNRIQEILRGNMAMMGESLDVLIAKYGDAARAVEHLDSKVTKLNNKFQNTKNAVTAGLKLEEARQDLETAKRSGAPINNEQIVGQLMVGGYSRERAEQVRRELLPSYGETVRSRIISDPTVRPPTAADRAALQQSLNIIRNQRINALQQQVDAAQAEYDASLRVNTTKPAAAPAAKITPTGGRKTPSRAAGKTPPTPEEIHREYVKRADDLLAAASAEETALRAANRLTEAEAAHTRVLSAQAEVRRRLLAGLEKYGESSAVGIENRQRLAALDSEQAQRAEQRLQIERDIAAQRAEQTRALEDDLMLAEAAARKLGEQSGIFEMRELQRNTARTPAQAARLGALEGLHAARPELLRDYEAAEQTARRARQAMLAQNTGDLGQFTPDNLAEALSRLSQLRDGLRALATDEVERLEIDRQSDDVLQQMATRLQARAVAEGQSTEAMDRQLAVLQQAAHTDEARAAFVDRRLDLLHDEGRRIVENVEYGDLDYRTAVKRLQAQRQSLDFIGEEQRRTDEQRAVDDRILSIYTAQARAVTERRAAGAITARQAVDELATVRAQVTAMEQNGNTARLIRDINADISGEYEKQADAIERQADARERLAAAAADLAAAEMERKQAEGKSTLADELAVAEGRAKDARRRYVTTLARAAFLPVDKAELVQQLAAIARADADVLKVRAQMRDADAELAALLVSEQTTQAQRAGDLAKQLQLLREERDRLDVQLNAARGDEAESARLRMAYDANSAEIAQAESARDLAAAESTLSNELLLVTARTAAYTAALDDAGGANGAQQQALVDLQDTMRNGISIYDAYLARLQQIRAALLAAGVDPSDIDSKIRAAQLDRAGLSVRMDAGMLGNLSPEQTRAAREKLMRMLEEESKYAGSDPARLQAITAALADLGKTAKESIEKADLGKAIWDVARDKDSAKGYFKELLQQAAKSSFSKIAGPMKDMLIDPKSGLPKALFRLFPSLGTEKGMEKAKGAMGAASSLYSLMNIDTTNSTEGLMSGAMSGLGVAGGLSQMGILSATPGVGWIAAGLGAVMGLMQSDKAKKRQEEQAQRIREAQLNELKKLNNALKPVSDYFNRGAFAALTSAGTYGGQTRYSWAVESARGEW